MAKLSVPLSGKSVSTVLLILFFIGACSKGEPPPAAGQPQGVPVKLQNVETSTVEESTEFVGTLEADNRVVVRPEADGRVVEIFVSSGSPVTQGTPIAQLRPERGQAQVRGAIADVKAAQASRDNAQAQIKSLEAQRVSDAANVELQKQQFQRISTLVSQGAYAQQQLDQVRRDRDAAVANLNATEEKIRAARATLDQENADLSSVKEKVAVAGEELRDSRVVAPINGVVSDVTVKLGDYVKAGDTLTTIIQNQSLNLRLSIPAERTSQLRIGLPVQLSGSKGNDILGTGRISFISPQVNSETQTILAKATFPNPEGSLRDAQQVQARVIWKRSPGVSIPTTAVSRIAGENFVFVAQSQGQSKLIARQKPVKLGEIKGNNYQVIEGIKSGEKIVTSGILNLTDGAPIIPQS
jgi:RND family efflux transporter MFP subunit